MRHRILQLSLALLSQAALRTAWMESSQLGSVPTWESNLRIWKLEKTPNYSQDSYSWAISDLSRARKLKTFIKGRILWKKGFFSLLSFFLSLSSFFFNRAFTWKPDCVSNVQIGSRLSKCCCLWLQPFEVEKKPKYEPIDLSAHRRLICHKLLSDIVVINMPGLLRREVWSSINI